MEKRPASNASTPPTKKRKISTGAKPQTPIANPTPQANKPTAPPNNPDPALSSRALSLQDTLRDLKNNSVPLKERLDVAWGLWENADQWSRSISRELIHLQLLQWLSFHLLAALKDARKEKFHMFPRSWQLIIAIEEDCQAANGESDAGRLQDTKLPSQALQALGEYIVYHLESNSFDQHAQELDRACQLLVARQWFRPALTLEQYAKFAILVLSTAMDLTVHQADAMQPPLENPAVIKLLHFLLTQLRAFLSQQPNHKKTFTVVLTRMLPVFASASVFLDHRGGDASSQQQALAALLRDCLCDVLFVQTECSHYGDDKKLVSYHHQLYSSLEELSRTDGGSFWLFPLLFQSFIGQYRQQSLSATSQLHFYEADMFHHLFSLLSQRIENSADLNASVGALPFTLAEALFGVSLQMLQLVTQNNINLTHRSNGQANSFTSFVNGTIQSMTPSCHALQWACLGQLLSIEHQCVVQVLESELYPLMRVHWGPAAIDFLIQLMALYTKLHQPEQFLTLFCQQLFQFLTGKNAEHVATVLQEHTSFWMAFAEFSSSLPALRTFEAVWKMFVDLLAPLAATLTPDKQALYDVYAHLLVVFLDAFKLTDTNADRSKSLVMETCQGVILPALDGMDLLHPPKRAKSKKRSSTSSSALGKSERAGFLVATLAVYARLSVVHSHCESLLFKSYQSSILETGFLEPPAYFSLLQGGEDAMEVDVIRVLDLVSHCSPAWKNEHPGILYGMISATCHRFYALYSCSVSVVKAIDEELRTLSSHIFRYLFLVLEDSPATLFRQTWNRNPLHITKDNLAVALFSLVCQSLFYLASSTMASEDGRQLLQFLFSPSSIQSAFLASIDSTQQALTIGFILRKLLENDQFYELHALRDHVCPSLSAQLRTELATLYAHRSIPSLPDTLPLTMQEAYRAVAPKKQKGKKRKSSVGASEDPSEDRLLQLVTVINAFPLFYFEDAHWAQLLPDVLLVERALVSVPDALLTTTQFQLACECRRILAASLRIPCHLETESALVETLDASLLEWVSHACVLLSKMMPHQAQQYAHFVRQFFYALSRASLQLAGRDCHAQVQRLLHQMLSLRQGPLAISSATQTDMLLECLRQWVRAMTDLAALQEDACRHQRERTQTVVRARRVQQSTLQMIDAHAPVEKDEDKDDDSDASDSESEGETKGEEKEQDDEDARMEDAKASLPASWKPLQTLLLQGLMQVCQSSHWTELAPGEDTLAFLSECVGVFGEFVGLDRYWYSEYLECPSSPHTQAFYQCCRDLFFLSQDILMASLGHADGLVDLTPRLGKQKELSQLMKSWKTARGTSPPSALPCTQALGFMEAFANGLHVPALHEGIQTEDVVTLVQLLHVSMRGEYNHFVEQFVPTDFFEDPFEVLSASPSTLSPHAASIKRHLQVVAAVVKRCSEDALQEVVHHLQRQLRSDRYVDGAVAVMCLYQLFAHGGDSPSRSRLLSSAGIELLSLACQMQYQPSADECLSRWIVETFQVLISSRKSYRFGENLVSLVLAIYPVFMQTKVKEQDGDEGVAESDARISVGNQYLQLDQSLYMKHCRFLSDCLIHRSKQCFRALPSFMRIVTLLLSTLGFMCHSSAHASRDSNPTLQEGIELCIRSFSRLLVDIGSRPSIRFYIPTLLVDIIYVLQHCSINPKQRTELHPGVFTMLNVCHEKDRRHVFVLLDNTGKLIFKELYERYEKEFKFTGKT